MSEQTISVVASEPGSRPASAQSSRSASPQGSQYSEADPGQRLPDAVPAIDSNTLVNQGYCDFFERDPDAGQELLSHPWDASESHNPINSLFEAHPEVAESAQGFFEQNPVQSIYTDRSNLYRSAERGLALRKFYGDRDREATQDDDSDEDPEQPRLRTQFALHHLDTAAECAKDPSEVASAMDMLHKRNEKGYRRIQKGVILDSEASQRSALELMEGAGGMGPDASQGGYGGTLASTSG